MRALPVLALSLALSACAGAQPQSESIQDSLNEFADLMGSDQMVLDPVIEMYEGFANVNVELEAGVTYILFLVAERGSGLDPDGDLLDPSGQPVAEAFEEGERETVTFDVPESGLHTVQVDLLGCTTACPVGVAIARL